MKRAAVFAHYDKDKIIDDYVIYYLKALKEIFDTIVFVSCNELEEGEKSKLDGIADYVITENHNEYVGECDFWGMTRNLEWQEHIQSFFFVFKKQVFTSKVFKDFMAGIKEEPNKLDIVTKYEIGLSRLLIGNGFKFDYAIKYKKKYRSNITIFKWREAILKYKMPLLKCSILRGKNTFHTTIVDWESVIPDGYPVELIKKNLERTREKKMDCSRFKDIRIFLFNIVGNLRKTPRRIFSNFIKYCLPFLSD